MPKFRLTSPSGEVYSITAPEGATEEDALRHLQNTLGAQTPPGQPAPNDAQPNLGGIQQPPGGQSQPDPGSPQSPMFGVTGAARGRLPRGDALAQSTAPAYDPVAEGARDSQRFESLKRGGADIFNSMTQMGLRAGEAVAPAGSEMEASWRANKEMVDAKLQKEEAELQALRGPDAGIDVARLIGNIFTTAPVAGIGLKTALQSKLLGKMVQGGVTGSLASMGQPVLEGDFADTKIKQGLMGLAAGAVAPAVTSAVARVISPKSSIDPAVQKLLDKGVTPTPGQIMGGGGKSFEEKLTSVPVLGGAIRKGQFKAMQQFNRAAIDDVLSPLGVKLPRNIQAGRDAVDFASKTIEDAYDDVIPRMMGRADKTFVADLTSIKAKADVNLTDSAIKQFNNKIRDIFSPTGGSGQIDGRTAKKIISKLGFEERRFSKSMDPTQQDMGGLFKDAKRAMHDMLSRHSSPDDAARLAATDKAFAANLRITDAAGRTGSKEGIFSPAALNSAVRKGDTSARKSRFARGGAYGQDFSEPAEAVLGRTVPDSGTAGRELAALAMNPLSSALLMPGYLAGGAVMGPAMTDPGRRALAALLARRGVSAPQIAGAVRRLGSLLAPGAGVAAGSSVQRK